MGQDKIYVTALTNQRYLPGVMALVRSLKKVGSKYNLAIMIPDSNAVFLSAKIKEYGILQYSGVFIIIQPDLILPNSIHADNNYYNYWKDTFFKLQAVSLENYEKIILIDSDMLVLQNIDALFEKNSFSAAVGGQCGHPEWNDLNSGLMVIEPGRDVYEKLIKSIEPIVYLRQEKGLNTGDQDVFQAVFPEWKEHAELLLPEKYNVFWELIDQFCLTYKCKPKEIIIVHFIGPEKPWDLPSRYYVRYFISHIKHLKINNLIYKTNIIKKYMSYCTSKKVIQ